MGFELPNLKRRETRAPAERAEANLFCMAMLDPADDKIDEKIKERTAKLTEDAEKKFPEALKDIRGLYVKDRLSMEFPDQPDKCKPLSDIDRDNLGDGLKARLRYYWLGKAGSMDPKDEAIMNVLRFYPDMPINIRKLAEQRELARLTYPEKEVREALVVLGDKTKAFDKAKAFEINATLDAWLRLPKGTDDERNKLRDELLQRAKIADGDRTQTETKEEQAKRLYPGSKEAQDAYLEKLKLNGAKLSDKKENLLTVWRMPPPSTGLEIPYSNTWRSDEWLLTFPGWQDPKDPKNPKANEAYAANFFETVRNAHLRTLYRKQHPGAEKDTAAEDEAVLEAYKQFSKHPRGFELALRKKMTPDGKVVGKWKPLDDAEQKELAGLDCYERYSDVYAYSHEEARILARKDPAKMKAEEFDLQNKLQYQINKYGR